MMWNPPRGWRRLARAKHAPFHDAYRHDDGSTLHLLYRVDFDGADPARAFYWWRLTDPGGSRHDTPEASFPGPVPFRWAGRILARHGNR